MTRRLVTVLALLIAVAVSAGAGHYVGARKMAAASGSVTLEHVALVSNTVTAPDLPEQSRKDLRLDVLTSLALVAHFRPEVSELDWPALNGLCFLRAVVLNDVMQLNAVEREIAELYRPYLVSVSMEVSSGAQRTLAPSSSWCDAAHQAVQDNVPAAGGSGQSP